jgi:hypothetical protein
MQKYIPEIPDFKTETFVLVKISNLKPGMLGTPQKKIFLEIFGRQLSHRTRTSHWAGST